MMNPSSHEGGFFADVRFVKQKAEIYICRSCSSKAVHRRLWLIYSKAKLELSRPIRR